MAIFIKEKDAEEKLNEIVLILKNNPKIKLEIKSYTDSQGDDQVNLELSKKSFEESWCYNNIKIESI